MIGTSFTDTTAACESLTECVFRAAKFLQAASNIMPSSPIRRATAEWWYTVASGHIPWRAVLDRAVLDRVVVGSATQHNAVQRGLDCRLEAQIAARDIRLQPQGSNSSLGA